MPKIPEISVGIQMERSVSVSSDRNIRDHLWRWSTYFGWNIPIEIRRTIFDKPVLCPNLGNSEMINSGKSYSYWLVRFNRKMSFHFPWVVPLISDRSVWHNGKQPTFHLPKRMVAKAAHAFLSEFILSYNKQSGPGLTGKNNYSF